MDYYYYYFLLSTLFFFLIVGEYLIMALTFQSVVAQNCTLRLAQSAWWEGPLDGGVSACGAGGGSGRGTEGQGPPF